MKISALRKMIHEEVRKAVRAELKLALTEARIPDPEPRQEPSGLDEIRNKFKSTQQQSLVDTYDDIQGRKPTSAPRGKPANPKTVLENGETYASGKNVLEWFQKSKDNQALKDHEERLAQMSKTDEVVSSIIKRKRI